MKIKLVVIIFVIILLVLAAFALKRYIDNSLVDKYGMVTEESNTDFSDSQST